MQLRPRARDLFRDPPARSASHRPKAKWQRAVWELNPPESASTGRCLPNRPTALERTMVPQGRLSGIGPDSLGSQPRALTSELRPPRCPSRDSDPDCLDLESSASTVGLDGPCLCLPRDSNSDWTDSESVASTVGLERLTISTCRTPILTPNAPTTLPGTSADGPPSSTGRSAPNAGQASASTFTTSIPRRSCRTGSGRGRPLAARPRSRSAASSASPAMSLSTIQYRFLMVPHPSIEGVATGLDAAATCADLLTPPPNASDE